MEPRNVSPYSARSLFSSLLIRYGRQNWWPADNHFEMMVGAILVQHTAWSNVEISLSRLRGAGLLNQVDLSRVSEMELVSLIRPSGFMRAKARALKGLAGWLVDKGFIQLDMRPNRSPQLRKELLTLPGIGNETADVIRLYAFSQKCFIWDSYALRLIQALGYPRLKGYQQALQHQDEFLNIEDFSLEDLKEYHGLIVAAGKDARRSGNWDQILANLHEGDMDLH